MNVLREGELTVERQELGADLIRVDWSGKSSTRQPEELLNPFLYEVLDAALRKTASIDMHFEKLEYLNSSTVGVLVHFLQRARSHGVRLTFLYRKSLRWQRLSFEALRVFEQVDRLIHVVPVPEA